MPFAYLQADKSNTVKTSFTVTIPNTPTTFLSVGPSYGKLIYIVRSDDYSLESSYSYLLKCGETSEYGRIYNYNSKNKEVYIEFSYDITPGKDISCSVVNRYNDLSLAIINNINEIKWNGFKDILPTFECKRDKSYNFICEDKTRIGSCNYDNNNNIIFTFSDTVNSRCYLLSDYNGNSISLEDSDVSNIMINNNNNNKLSFPTDSTSKSIRMIKDKNINLYLGKEESSVFSIDKNEILIDISTISDINNAMNENMLNSNLENGRNIIIRELKSMKEIYTTIIKISKDNKILKITTNDDIESIKTTKRILSQVKTNHKKRLRGKATTTTTEEEVENEKRILQVGGDKIYEISTYNSNSVHIEMECSGQGTCNHKTGECECYNGYEGSSCNRLECPNNCNGYGECVLLNNILDNKELNSYVGYGNDRIYGCKCDKKRRGYDCSLIECPSSTTPDDAEHRDCSGRGICDYKTGTCQCFNGYRGSGCEIKSNYS